MSSIPFENVSQPPAADLLPPPRTPANAARRADDSFERQLRRADGQQPVEPRRNEESPAPWEQRPPADTDPAPRPAQPTPSPEAEEKSDDEPLGNEAAGGSATPPAADADKKPAEDADQTSAAQHAGQPQAGHAAPGAGAAGGSATPPAADADKKPADHADQTSAAQHAGQLKAGHAAIAPKTADGLATPPATDAEKKLAIHAARTSAAKHANQPQAGRTAPAAKAADGLATSPATDAGKKLAKDAGQPSAEKPVGQRQAGGAAPAAKAADGLATSPAADAEKKLATDAGQTSAAKHVGQLQAGGAAPAAITAEAGAAAETNGTRDARTQAAESPSGKRVARASPPNSPVGALAPPAHSKDRKTAQGADEAGSVTRVARLAEEATPGVDGSQPSALPDAEALGTTEAVRRGGRSARLDGVTRDDVEQSNKTKRDVHRVRLGKRPQADVAEAKAARKGGQGGFQAESGAAAPHPGAGPPLLQSVDLAWNGLAPVGGGGTVDNLPAQDSTTPAVVSSKTAEDPGQGPGALNSRLPQVLLPRSSAGAAKARTMGQAEQQRFVQRVIGAFHAARDGGGELRLRLSPPELGSLRLHLKLGGDALTARIEVETAAARSILLDNLPVLRGRLAEQGFRVEQFDVDLADQHSNGPPNGQAGSQGGRQDAPWLPSDSSGEMGGGEPGANRPPTPSNRDNSQLNVIV